MSAANNHAVPEPDEQVLLAVINLIRGMPRLQGAEVEGYARGFLLQFPSIAKAETARILLSRCEACLPEGALLVKTQQYLSEVEAQP